MTYAIEDEYYYIIYSLKVMKKLSILLIVFLFVFLVGFVFKTYAQQNTSLGVATAVEISEKGAQDGDIISSKAGGGYVRSRLSYDPFLFGVVSLKPAVYLYDKNSKN